MRKVRGIGVAWNVDLGAATIDSLQRLAQPLALLLGRREERRDPRVRLSDLGEETVLVHPGESPTRQDGLAVHHDEVDFVPGCRIDELVHGIVEWCERQAVKPVRREVGDASLLYISQLAAAPHPDRSPHSRCTKCVYRLRPWSVWPLQAACNVYE